MNANEAMADALARTARALGVVTIPADVVARAHALLAGWAAEDVGTVGLVLDDVTTTEEPARGEPQGVPDGTVLRL